MMSQQKNLLDDLGFTEFPPLHITPKEAVMICETLAKDFLPEEIFEALHERPKGAFFIEQRGLGGAMSSGHGVAATLPDGSNWMRDRDLSDTERIQLELEGFANHSLQTQSLLATHH